MSLWDTAGCVVIVFVVFCSRRNRTRRIFEAQSIVLSGSKFVLCFLQCNQPFVADECAGFILFFCLLRFLLTFSKTKWVPEISHHAPGIPYILVGTKIDLRSLTDEQHVRTSEGYFRDSVSSSHARTGKRMAEEVGARKYLEVSALAKVNIKELMHEGLSVAIESEGPYQPAQEGAAKARKGGCILL